MKLYCDKFEYAQGFYEKGNSKLDETKLYKFPLTGCDKEHLGCKLGAVFRNLYRMIHDTRKTNTFDFVKKEVLQLREDNPELTKAEQWHAFEDLFFSEFTYYMSRRRYSIKTI